MTPERYKQVGQFFRAAQEIPPEQRARFIAQACGSDKELQEHVESLLAYDAQTPDGRFLVYSGVEVGTTFPLKAVTADGKPYSIPNLTLSRGANRFSFLPGRPILTVLKGDIWHKNFWLIDLLTGQQRQLTNFSREFLITDFDVSPDGQEIVFSRLKENSNIILIDLPKP
jgi:hypothetical protein